MPVRIAVVIGDKSHMYCRDIDGKTWEEDDTRARRPAFKKAVNQRRLVRLNCYYAAPFRVKGEFFVINGNFDKQGKIGVGAMKINC